jgi:glycosyltransferase involved in cell wall biosynthesis
MRICNPPIQARLGKGALKTRGLQIPFICGSGLQIPYRKQNPGITNPLYLWFGIANPKQYQIPNSDPNPKQNPKQKPKQNPNPKILFSFSDMRVLILLQRFQAGGAERQASYLAKYLSEESGYDVQVLAFGAKGDFSRHWFENGKIRLKHLGFKEHHILYFGWSPLKRLKKFRDLWRLGKEIKNFSPDVILPFTYQPNRIAAAYWKSWGAKKCIWNQRDEGRYFDFSQQELKDLKNCSAWVSNSTEGAIFLEKMGIPNVNIIQNGIEIPDQTIHFDENPTILKFVMMANFHVYKDHLTLLQAWKLLREKHSNIELHLYGKKGNALEAILTFIDENGLNDSVKIFKSVPDVYGTLRNYHVSVFSSVKEGTPNAVLESMAMGLPVVATKILGIEGALGFDYPLLANSKDSQDLMNKMDSIILNSKLRKILGLQNLAKIKNEFSIQKMQFSFKKELFRT